MGASSKRRFNPVRNRLTTLLAAGLALFASGCVRMQPPVTGPNEPSPPATSGQLAPGAETPYGQSFCPNVRLARQQLTIGLNNVTLTVFEGPRCSVEREFLGHQPNSMDPTCTVSAVAGAREVQRLGSRIEIQGQEAVFQPTTQFSGSGRNYVATVSAPIDQVRSFGAFIDGRAHFNAILRQTQSIERYPQRDGNPPIVSIGKRDAFCLPPLTPQADN